MKSGKLSTGIVLVLYTTFLSYDDGDGLDAGYLVKRKLEAEGSVDIEALTAPPTDYGPYLSAIYETLMSKKEG